MLFALHAAAFSADHYVDKLTLVHVHTTMEIDIVDVNFERVATENVIVHERAKQVVRRGNRVQIAREMQIDFGHGYYLRVSTARRAAFDAKHGAERRLTKGQTRAFPYFGKSVRKTDRNGGFPLA